MGWMMIESLVGGNGRTPRKPTHMVFVHHKAHIARAGLNRQDLSVPIVERPWPIKLLLLWNIFFFSFISLQERNLFTPTKIIHGFYLLSNLVILVRQQIAKKLHLMKQAWASGM